MLLYVASFCCYIMLLGTFEIMVHIVVHKRSTCNDMLRPREQKKAKKKKLISSTSKMYSCESTIIGTFVNIIVWDWQTL